MLTELEKQEVRDTAKELGLSVKKSLKIFRGEELIHQAMDELELYQFMQYRARGKNHNSLSENHDSYEFKTEPYDHQRKGFNQSCDKRYYAFL